MSRIRDIDIEKVLIDSKYKPYLYEALIELDKEFDINGWSKFLKPNHIENIYYPYQIININLFWNINSSEKKNDT